ncbi:GntR family transcriptional regulator [Nocardioides zeae]|uniref:GntR family transcriptional regulator n=1 Tax=Nocardioides imazamoxiresistens TaxID=3231893 RepID=A0ABU3Q0X9_9ACTN|nr:GntR family transcriptional regulator [Nocardioides zeae]MDT9595134.1 GntR family transcriptional regulator [Nocardioides zeae]
MAASELDPLLASLSAARLQRRAVMSTSAERAAHALREQVTEGTLRSGTRLPEVRLAEALGVSRNTLREALSQLVAERILVRVEHRGVLVATPDTAAVRDVYAARRIIEPAAVLHGPAVDAAHLDALDAAVREGTAASGRGDWTGVGSANQHFHRAVVALAGSERLVAQMELLLAEMRLFFHQMGDPEPFHAPYLDENAVIAGHLRAGRREAAATRLAAYLGTAEEQLVAGFGEIAERARTTPA